MKFLNTESAGTTDHRPTLVLVHGVAGSLHIWDPVFDRLAKRYRVVRLDLLGYGHSPKPRVTYTPGTHVAAIRETLRRRGFEPPYVLVGLSMGVTLVLEYASEYPDEVDSLVCIGFPYYADERQAVAGLRNNVWAGLVLTHPLLARVYVPTVWTLGRIGVLPPRLFTNIYTPIQAHETLLNPYRVFRSNVINSMVRVRFDRLLDASADKRRLFIHGERDTWAASKTVRDVVSGYARTEFVEVPDAEHNLVVLEPDRVMELISAFVIP